ncbi:MAG: hypothetical protein DI535_00020 [Citrobacter freundii]|nr:MAG: hypothetical protein DI535_00020 [Citrobacter freundii]
MSWGNKLLITFVAFGSGIIFLVYRCMKTEFELVDKDYYKNELAYQQVIDATQRTGKLSSAARFTQSESGLQLQLPSEMKGHSIKGEILFYCAYDSHKDRRVSLEPDSSAFQQFDRQLLAPGTYTAKLSWSNGPEQYYFETPLTIR